jgi:hypothetical protein
MTLSKGLGSLPQILLKLARRSSSNQRKFIAEVIGTFIVVVFATGSVVIDAKVNGRLGVPFIAFAPFVGVAIGVYLFGKTSIAQFNPAVTVGFMTATLVVGLTFATTTTIATQSTAYAYSKIQGGDEGNSKNGNTLTIQKCKQATTQSGFDNSQDQECANLICTYAENNATCTQEGDRSAAAAPIKLTCEECFRKFLTPEQLQSFLFNVFPGVGLPLEQVCAEKALTERDVRTFLLGIVDLTTTNNLIACLKQAGFLP